MRAFSRFGFLVIGGAVSLVVIALLLSSRAVTTRLENFGIADYIWDWGNPNITELTVVVFGDSWVDDGVPVQNERGFNVGGKQESIRHPLQGPSWTEVLCKELKCTSYLNFASSAPITIESPPSGALTSNALFKNTTLLPGVIPTTFEPKLPDLAAQVSSYLTLSSSLPPSKTLFILSFGLWDTYHYASLALNKDETESVTVASIDAMFVQLDTLFTAFADKKENTLNDEELENEAKNIHDFQVVIPQLIDPTFLPGWRSSRPTPLPPTSIAEEQRVAVTLVTKWNSYLQGKINNWISESPGPAKPTASAEASSKKSDDGKDDKSKDEEAEEESSHDQAESAEELDELAPAPLLWQKTIHFPDLKTYFLDSLRTKYLESHKVFDANGLGTADSPYESVSVPCAPVAGFEELKRDGRTARGRGIDAFPTDDDNVRGAHRHSLSKGSCGDAERWLFWDEWNLGPKAQREVGKSVAVVVTEGNRVKEINGKESLKEKKASRASSS